MRSGAEVLKELCHQTETEPIFNFEHAYLYGMIMALYLNDIITSSEANAAKAIVKAVWAGMHPNLAEFYK